MYFFGPGTNLGDPAPLILQGAGTRETLDSAQTARVAAMGGLVNPAGPIISASNKYLVYAGIGLLAAFALSRSRSGKLW